MIKSKFQSCCDDKNQSIYKLNETQEAELEKENSGISFGQVLIWFYLVFVVGIMVVDFFRSGICKQTSLKFGEIFMVRRHFQTVCESLVPVL